MTHISTGRILGKDYRTRIIANHRSFGCGVSLWYVAVVVLEFYVDARWEKPLLPTRVST